MREQIEERGEDPENYPVLAANAKPTIFDDLIWVWEGFGVLSSSRQMGMNGPQPLILSEIIFYLDYIGIDSRDEREEFLHLVQFLDRVYIAWHIAKSGKK